MLIGFDIRYMIFILPAVLLAMGAQAWIQSAYAAGQRRRASMTGAQAARAILDANGLHHIPVVETPGHLSDHYDPGARVVRLSTEVFHNATLSSVGIAAHEVGHALQHAFHYIPLVMRNVAVPLAGFGSSFGMIIFMVGLGMTIYNLSTFGPQIAWLGIILFGCTVLFQLVNLPVEFNASTRGKRQLVDLGIVHESDMAPVRSVLTAAALTYVAATLHSILTLVYYASMLGGGRSREE